MWGSVCINRVYAPASLKFLLFRCAKPKFSRFLRYGFWLKVGSVQRSKGHDSIIMVCWYPITLSHSLHSHSHSISVSELVWQWIAIILLLLNDLSLRVHFEYAYTLTEWLIRRSPFLQIVYGFIYGVVRTRVCIFSSGRKLKNTCTFYEILSKAI